MAPRERPPPLFTEPPGQRRLVRHILARLPPHTCYVELMGGPGAVLLAKPRSTIEIWAGRDPALTNLFRCLKFHSGPLAEALTERLAHPDAPAGTSEVAQAALMIWRRQRLAPVSTYSTARGRSRPPAPALERLIAAMQAVTRRLQHVILEDAPWPRLLALYDSPGSVFYCDLPDAADAALQQALAAALKALSGRFVLRCREAPGLRALYAGLSITAFTRRQGEARRPLTELLIESP
jgi:DNA adenine methylase